MCVCMSIVLVQWTYPVDTAIVQCILMLGHTQVVGQPCKEKLCFTRAVSGLTIPCGATSPMVLSLLCTQITEQTGSNAIHTS